MSPGASDVCVTYSMLPITSTMLPITSTMLPITSTIYGGACWPLQPSSVLHQILYPTARLRVTACCPSHTAYMLQYVVHHTHSVCYSMLLLYTAPVLQHVVHHTQHMLHIHQPSVLQHVRHCTQRLCYSMLPITLILR